MIKKYLPWILLAAFIIIQFFQIDRTNPSYDKTKDFFETTQVADDMKIAITNSCYDCHSHEVTYPWYTYINPVGWWVKGHVNGGTDKLNFSTWKDYPANKAHSDARLSKEARAGLVEWFNKQAGK